MVFCHALILRKGWGNNNTSKTLLFFRLFFKIFVITLFYKKMTQLFCISDISGRFSLGQSSEEGEGSTRNSIEGGKPPTQQRSNATMHVCWHRNTSVSASEHLTSLQVDSNSCRAVFVEVNFKFETYKTVL